MCKLGSAACHVGVRQVRHKHIRSQVGSRQQAPTGPHYSGAALSLHTRTNECLHEPDTHSIIRLEFACALDTRAHKYMHAFGFVNTNILEVRLHAAWARW